ncbi:hypothetical protein M2273_002716 [Mucilaginibacter lappiensis]
MVLNPSSPLNSISKTLKACKSNIAGFFVDTTSKIIL